MSDNYTRLTDDFWVSPQLSAADITEAASNGFKLVINNRPDHEAPGQPKSDDLKAAAEAAGIHYAHIPVSGGLSMEQVDAECDARRAHPGKAVAFCASGMRSAFLYAYAAARSGTPIDEIMAVTAAAGYDVTPHRPALQSLSEAFKG